MFSCVILSTLMLYLCGYRYSFSDSLPYRFYRIIPLYPDDNISLHDYVVVNADTISHPTIQTAIERKYIIMNRLLLKEIGAVSGDSIVISGDIVFINETETPLLISHTDGQQRRLTPFPTPLILDKDSYWLISNPIGGFDSRYFGPVSRHSILYRAKPVRFGVSN